MIIKGDLKSGVLLKRYKRFFADVQTETGELTVHVPNSGSMKGCSEPGSPCLYSVSDDPNRKLKGTLHFVQAKSGGWVGINTGLPNPLAYELWESRQFFPWQEADRCEREIKIHESSRLDLVMWSSRDGFLGARPKLEDLEKNRFHFVEVKNVSLEQNGAALFPDAVTERGQKHLLDLIDLKKMGHTSEILFVIQRQDVTEFRAARDIDPIYAEYLERAAKAGVTLTPLVASLTQSPSPKIQLSIKPLPVVF